MYQTLIPLDIIRADGRKPSRRRNFPPQNASLPVKEPPRLPQLWRHEMANFVLELAGRPGGEESSAARRHDCGFDMDQEQLRRC